MRTLSRPRKASPCGAWQPPGGCQEAGVPAPAREGPADFAKCGLLPEEEAARGEPDLEQPEPDVEADFLQQDEEVPSKGGAATIVCDGKGGYRVALNGWAGAPCGTEDCVRRHEQSHANDWKKRWPEGCKGKADGATIPLGGAGYAAFLKTSECTAHTVDLACAAKLLAAKTKAKAATCVKEVKDYIKLTEQQKKSYC